MYFHDRLLATLLSKTVTALTDSLNRYNPDSIYSKFSVWCLNAKNPHRNIFLQVLGIYQLVNLTAKLFENLLSDQEWQDLLPYCATLNAYLTCEAVSDNVAIGLARPKVQDRKAEDRRQVVTTFNQATIERLKGTVSSAQQLLSPVEAMTQQISMFKSSLSPQKLLYLAVSSVKQQQSWSLRDLNASLQAVLVANAETCAEVAKEIDGLAGAELVRQGLIDRYESVNCLLANQPMSREKRVEIGAQAILVAPTIGYYVTILAHKVRPLPKFEAVVADGSLATALYDAALLVRLLNDLGTSILEMSTGERHQIIKQIEQCWQTEFTESASLLEVLSKFTETCEDLTRIRKDTLFGEYNLALDLLPEDAGMGESLKLLEKNLGHYSDLYAYHWARLSQVTDRITDVLGDDLVSNVILRFVVFHQKLYSNAFASQAGEYAV